MPSSGGPRCYPDIIRRARFQVKDSRRDELGNLPRARPRYYNVAVENRVLTIVGCTASGKGTLARALAARLGAELVSIDSMKVYRGMDVGTAKPSPEARAAIPHHLIDVADPKHAKLRDISGATVAQIFDVTGA